MKSLKLSPGKFPDTVHVPGSKSYANRALILSALRPGSFTIHDLPESTDVVYLVDCFRKIGLTIEQTGSTCKVTGSFPECENGDCELSVGEGGTTARFLASLLIKGSRKYSLILGERLKERPWQEFVDLVKRFGGKAELQGAKLVLQGPVKLSSVVKIDCSRTTQYASGIQLAYAFDGVEIQPENLSSSMSYWKMTEVMSREFEKRDSYRVPLDWSSASYPLAFGAINQKIIFPHLAPDSFQADSKFHGLLESLGALAKDQVYPLTKPRDVVMDVSDCLDLVPALGFLLGHIPGLHELKGIENLVHKESDRLAEVMKLLKIFERDSYTSENSLFIKGDKSKVTTEKNLIMPDDHRMVMTGALFLLHHSGGTILPAEAVAKSYPRFFDLLEAFCHE